MTFLPHAEMSPDAWRRHLELVFSGLAPPADPTPLGHPALTPPTVAAITASLDRPRGRSTG